MPPTNWRPPYNKEGIAWTPTIKRISGWTHGARAIDRRAAQLFSCWILLRPGLVRAHEGHRAINAWSLNAMKRNLEKHVVRISAHQLEDFMDRKLHLRAAGRTGETLSRAVLNLCQGQIRSARTTFEFN